MPKSGITKVELAQQADDRDAADHMIGLRSQGQSAQAGNRINAQHQTEDGGKHSDPRSRGSQPHALPSRIGRNWGVTQEVCIKSPR